MLNPEQSTELEKERKAKIRNLALFYCSRRETCRADLEKYLHRKFENWLKFEPCLTSYIESLIEQLEKENWFNQDRFTEIYIRSQAIKGKDARVIQQKLKLKLISIDLKVISQILLESSGMSEEQRAIQLVIRKFKALPKNLELKIKRRIYSLLVRRGFSSGVIQKVMKLDDAPQSK